MINNSISPEPLEHGLRTPNVKEIDNKIPTTLHTLPHYITFSQLVNLGTRTYRYTFDEALRNNRVNALAMRRDPIVYYSVRMRQIALSQLPWKLEPAQDIPANLIEKYNNFLKAISNAIKDFPRFNNMILALDECIWYGKSAVQIGWKTVSRNGMKVLSIHHWLPVNGDKIRFKWDGTPGIMINYSAFPAEHPRISQTDLGMVYWLEDPQDRLQFAISKYEQEDADFFEGELAGAVHGVGLRSRLYWLWHLKATILSYMIDYLQLTGSNGLTVFFYEEGNPTSMEEVKTAVKTQQNQHILLFPRRRDGGQGGPGIMHIPPSGAGISLFEAMVNEYFDSVIQACILGQPLIVKGGMASVANYQLHYESMTRVIKYDAENISETITKEIVHPMCRYTMPTLPEEYYPSFKFIISPSNANQMLQFASALVQMGIAVDENQIRDIAGLIKPREDEYTSASGNQSKGLTPDMQALLQQIAMQEQAMQGQQEQTEEEQQLEQQQVPMQQLR